ncbi:hypothetical protein CVO77_00195 [Sphingopyxis lindanitolerans]|uniref:PhoD-like phosphatase metallophosphatase domain-containing protein n=1 Tax=Sphingopyxis lindanitolerans TaxID=2054227 RepID=A0A2S8BAF3_9SPHN|nr:alkaline phosphatase D family protein [Sphingopyxis lindanitolerans]PQM29395.1 hypothetical protein CVO77_00195 [Sphingopyxis lindanitolerans]
MTSVISILCGGLTSPFGQSATARVRGRTDAASVRLAVARDPGMMWATYLPAQAPTAEGVFDFTITGLAPNMQRYYYAVECDGDLDLTKVGTFQTFPEEGSKRNHRIIVGNCLGGDWLDPRWMTNYTSNSPVLDIIAREDALLTNIIGDWGYNDYYLTNNGISDSVANSRAFIAENLLRPRQQALFLRRPMNWFWDDHDWGVDDGDKTTPSRAFKNQVYRETMPHYLLPSSTGFGIWHSFMIGDVLHIATDLRTDRDPNTDADGVGKRMMSAEQEAWFEDLLIAASTDPLVGDVIWYSSSPWLGAVGVNGQTTASLFDHWALFSYQRDRLAAMIEAFKMQSGKAFAMVHGDIHALAYDDGSNNSWGGFPVYACGAIDSPPNVRGGPFSGGYSTGAARYMRLDKSYYPGGSLTTMEGRIWDTTWKKMAYGAPLGFLPAVTA